MARVHSIRPESTKFPVQLNNVGYPLGGLAGSLRGNDDKTPAR